VPAGVDVPRKPFGDDESTGKEGFIACFDPMAADDPGQSVAENRLRPVNHVILQCDQI